MTAQTGQPETEIILDGLHFGECLRWHEERLYLCDMYGDSIHRLDPASGDHEVISEVFHPGGIGWLPDGRMLVVASEDKRIFEVTPEGNQLYVDLSDFAPGWTNDMLVDEAGRAYVGNFGYDLFTDEPRATQLILVQPDGSVSWQPGELVFPNGIVKRPDGTIVVAETFANRLAVYSVGEDGALTPEGKIELEDDLMPDAIAADAAGGIWLASVLTAEIVRVDAEGSCERHAVSQNAYGCALGGEDGRTLFIATAPDYEPESRRANSEGRIETLRVEIPAAPSPVA